MRINKMFALCFVVILLAPALTVAAPEFTLKFGHLANEENSWHKAAMKFAELVKERSNGRIEVKVYPNEQLGKELDTVTSIQMGTADMVISGGSLMNWAPRIGVMECPTAIRDSEHLQKVAGGEIGKEIEAEILEKVGLRAIAWFERGPRNLTSNKPMKTPEDVQGMILRVPNSILYVKFWEAVGAKPTPMAFSEVFTSLQQGTIDGQENPLSLIKSAGFFEVQKYVNLTEHLITWIYVLIGEKQFQAMPADLQQIILEAGKEMQAYEHQLFLEDELKLKTELEAAGMTFVEVDKQAFAEKGKPGLMEGLTPEQKELFTRIVETK
ncbi:TRAP dicarboxylate transporter, DctP subunit [Candidatus Vecturithrix granuli]|uniref:TRAP dicarboxylate transporter, DctP subunit n=1 Tax=Vecturithrix granuli TaxID=1499967 RepID=A0A081C5F7_VECG1|nr:TRAP dicarboxylate transporter, DctP subunit [Candidatus Vecturithrix granuli]